MESSIVQGESPSPGSMVPLPPSGTTTSVVSLLQRSGTPSGSTCRLVSQSQAQAKAKPRQSRSKSQPEVDVTEPTQQRARQSRTKPKPKADATEPTPKRAKKSCSKATAEIDGALEADLESVMADMPVADGTLVEEVPVIPLF